MAAGDPWRSGEAYERFMGRWSALAAEPFLRWLAPEPGGRWLDVGCGTGALSARIVALAAPVELVGIDPSAPFVETAAARVAEEHARFLVGDAQSLPFDDETFDAAVSGLVLNFVPDAAQAVAEMARVVRRGGVVAAYVWDYAEGMQFLRELWRAAAALDPAAAELDEGRRFAVANREGLAPFFVAAGLRQIETAAITIPTRFADFDDYWAPFLGGQGPAASYVTSLDDDDRERLRAELERRLPRDADGAIPLSARAWATRGRMS